MVEADLYERQTEASYLQFDKISSNSLQKESCTGFVSDEKLVEEAANINELILMSSMLHGMVNYETATQQFDADLFKKTE